MANCKSQIWNFEQESRVREATERQGEKKAIGKGMKDEETMKTMAREVMEYEPAIWYL